MTTDVNSPGLPYRVAVLCYIYDHDDRLLLLHRSKAPNAGMYSPVGGKLEVSEGEAPHICAVREVSEETGIELTTDDVRMSGILAETAYEGKTHWLIFLFEVTRPVAHDEITEMVFDEGTLEWVPTAHVHEIGIPETDRRILWPLVQQYRGGFFTVHVDCRGGELQWTVHDAR